MRRRSLGLERQPEREGSRFRARFYPRPIPCPTALPSTISRRSSSTALVGGGNDGGGRSRTREFSTRPLPTSTRSDYVRASFIVTQRAPPRAGAFRACVRTRASVVRASQIESAIARFPPLSFSLSLSVHPSVCLYLSVPSIYLSTSASGILSLFFSLRLCLSLFPSRFYVSRKAKSVAFRAGWCARRWRTREPTTNTDTEE